MIDGIPNRPLYFYQKDIIECGGIPLNWIREPGHSDIWNTEDDCRS